MFREDIFPNNCEEFPAIYFHLKFLACSTHTHAHVVAPAREKGESCNNSSIQHFIYEKRKSIYQAFICWHIRNEFLIIRI